VGQFAPLQLRDIRRPTFQRLLDSSSDRVVQRHHNVDAYIDAGRLDSAGREHLF
jgi:hypothetical protein